LRRRKGPTEFKLIRIPEKHINIDTVKEAVISAINAEVHIKRVSYDEFRGRTTQDNVKRYIMAIRTEFRQYLKDMKKDLEQGKTPAFQQNLNDGKITSIEMPKLGRPDEDPSKADKRYGILDIHKIDITYDQSGKDTSRKKPFLERIEDHSEEVKRLDHDMKQQVIHDKSWIINLCLNPLIPVISFELLDAIAMRISRITDTEVLALEMIPSNGNQIFWEHYASYKANVATRTLTVPYGKHLFTEYKKHSGIEIRKILACMDKNVDVVMAPKDLEEISRWGREFSLAKEFMKKSGLHETEKAEYIKLEEDITLLESERAQTEKMLFQDADVESIYFKIRDPRELAKFKWRSLHRQDETKLN